MLKKIKERLIRVISLIKWVIFGHGNIRKGIRFAMNKNPDKHITIVKDDFPKRKGATLWVTEKGRAAAITFFEE